MKTTVCLLALAVFTFVGCKAPTTTVPKGSKIIFQTDEQAEAFRAATLVDPTKLSPVVTLDRDLQVILP
jgi:hypothetical protein